MERRRGDRGFSSPAAGVHKANASNWTDASMIKSTSRGSLLHLRGVRVGVLERTFGPLCKHSRITMDVPNSIWDTDEVARCYAYLLNDPGFVTKDDDREKVVAIADSLVVGPYRQEEGDEDERMVKDFPAFIRRVQELRSDSERNRSVLQRVMLQSEGGSFRDFVDNIVGWTSRFRLFNISEDWFGMGPDHVRVGYVLVVPLGVNIPTVMRRKGTRWMQMGAAYVSVVMKVSVFEMNSMI